MNAANEEAVFAFLKDKIKLGEIYNITEKMVEKYGNISNSHFASIDDILNLDNEIRTLTKQEFNL